MNEEKLNENIESEEIKTEEVVSEEIKTEEPSTESENIEEKIEENTEEKTNAEVVEEKVETETEVEVPAESAETIENTDVKTEEKSEAKTEVESEVKTEKAPKAKKEKTSKAKSKSKEKKASKDAATSTATSTEASDKTEKKSFSLTVKFSEIYEKLQSSILLLIIVCVAAFLIMGASATAIFFYNVKGYEQVLVPNVVGKKLEDALLDMQVKELYPKINLRYSNTPGDEGTILEQSPESGAIVRGYSRVNLVVSRGVVVDKVGDYVGMNIEELKLNLQTLFAGQTRPLIVLSDPEYKPDLSAAGTILEQDPPEGTDISQPVTVKLIVSRGPNYDNTRAPHVIGQSVNDVLQTIARSKIIFDFTSHIATEDEKPGTVVKQDNFDSDYVPNYSRVNVEFAFPEDLMNESVYGIFQTELSAYPYPVQMRIDAVPSEGSAYTILNFLHSGGNLTVPYAVPAGTKLVLYVVDKETASITVN